MFHSLPSLKPVELIATAFNVYRRFATWLKKKGLIRLADADDSFEKENPLASCLRGSLGIGKIAALKGNGDIEFTEEDADAQRFALRRSPHVGEFGGFSIHAGVTVNADDRDGRGGLPASSRQLAGQESSCFGINQVTGKLAPGERRRSHKSLLCKQLWPCCMTRLRKNLWLS